jgi:3-(3-hydroxy-phenyl)propionate hydroxylase
MLHSGEDQTPFLEPARIGELIAPWVADEQVEVERAVVYTFHARTAARWRARRVLLAGDAAHVMPPFAGQGFSSGARDAGNLAWKLDAVLHGAPERLMDSYETERRPHVTGMQKLAVRLGSLVQTTHDGVGEIRDRTLALLDRTGALRRISDRAKPLSTYRAGAFVSRPHPLAFRRTVGSLFPQPDRLDERLGRGWAVVCRSGRAASAWRERGLRAVEPAHQAWLDRHGLDWALLRPDRYVFACGGHDQLPAALDALRATVGAGLRTEHDETMAVAS